MIDINKLEKVKNIIFIIDGGLGREIASTGVIKSLKNKYPDKNIIVIAGFPDIFLYNPNVRRVFNFNNPLYFYDDYINDECIVIKREPYYGYNYISKNSHLIQNWCDEIGIESICNYPDLYFLENEIESAKMYVDKITDNNKKELILLQWIGGKVPQDKSLKELKASLASMYRRALPQDIAQGIADKLIEKGYVVKDIGHENFPTLKEIDKIQFPIRSILILLKFAKTFIGIDSFLQHASASETLRKKGIVCWGGTSPICLGYDTNINLITQVCPTPFCHRPNSYLFDMQPHGAMWDCLYGEKCLKSFSVDEIIKIFEENFENSKKKK